MSENGFSVGLDDEDTKPLLFLHSPSIVSPTLDDSAGLYNTSDSLLWHSFGTVGLHHHISTSSTSGTNTTTNTGLVLRSVFEHFQYPTEQQQQEPQISSSPSYANFPYTTMQQYPSTMQPTPFPTSPPHPQLSSFVFNGLDSSKKDLAAVTTTKPADSPPSATRGKKRKLGSDDEGAHSHAHADSQSASAAADNKKRTKTSRACDSCRSRKIRCDIIPDSDTQICKHCKQYGFECTFFLPITETRFKRKKTEDEHPEKETKSVVSRSEPIVNGNGSSTSPQHHDSTLPNPHPTAPLKTSKIYEEYDLKYHHSYNVSFDKDTGLIQVSDLTEHEHDDLAMPSSLDPRLERGTVEQLVNTYFTHVAPSFPVILAEEFLSNPKPDPFLLYCMCLVAACRREVPHSVFETIRHTVHTIIRAKDILSTPSLTNVQALLILSMSADCHSPFVPNALSAVWVRLGSAIRMAQDIGLHRAETSTNNLELKRRVWATCIIADRWMSTAFSHPPMINVEDCDACLPCSEKPEDLYCSHMVRLSLLVGRINRTIYGPSGLKFISDEALQGLLSELEEFNEKLPYSLKYAGPQSPRPAGLIHLFFSCACALFWRVFMRKNNENPAHLTFQLTQEKWSLLTTFTGEAIEWLNLNDQHYDTWMMVEYATVSCALVQYHVFVKQKDEQSVQKLRVLRDMLKRWETSISTEQMSSRRKMAEIVTLLFEATQAPQQSEGASTDSTSSGSPPKGQPSTERRQPPASQSIPIAGDASSPLSVTVTSTSRSKSRAPSTRSQMSQMDPDLLTSSAFAPPLPAGSTSQLSDAALEALFGSSNPSMNSNKAGATPPSTTAAPVNFSDLQQMSNSLDSVVNPTLPNSAPALTGLGYLEGLPAELWNFMQWDDFFQRLNPSGINPPLT